MRVPSCKKVSAGTGLGLILGVALRYFDPKHTGAIDIGMLQEPVDSRGQDPYAQTVEVALEI
jgi:hypothetical protein